MKRKPDRGPIVLALAVFIAMAAIPSASAQSPPPDMTHHEYGHVLASRWIEPGQKWTVTVPDQYVSGGSAGHMTITVPGDEFTAEVRFEILSGSNNAWQREVQSGQEVVANVAFRVINRNNGQLIGMFHDPVTVTITSSMINSNSIAWETTP